MKSTFAVSILALASLLASSGCSKQPDSAKDGSQNAAGNSPDAAQQAADNAKDAAGRSTGSASRAGEAMREAVAPTVIPAGTTLTVRLGETISAKTATPGQSFTGSLARSVSVDGREVIPAGSNVSGEVTQAQSAGKFKGAGVLAVRLTSVEARGRTYNISTSTVAQAVKGKGKRSLIVGGGGAALGALIGGLAGGGKGAGIGALAGGGAGTAGAAYTGNKELVFPAETALSFKLKDSVTLK